MSKLCIRSTVLVLYGGHFSCCQFVCLKWKHVLLPSASWKDLAGEEKQTEGRLFFLPAQRCRLSTAACRFSRTERLITPQSWHNIKKTQAFHEYKIMPPKQQFRHVGEVWRGTFLPLILVHIHNNSQDVEHQHHATYNVGNHHNQVAAAWIQTEFKHDRTPTDARLFRVSQFKSLSSAKTTRKTYL